MQNHFNRKRPARQDTGTPIYRADGKIIGAIRGDVFIKRVDASKHFLRVPPAIGFDVDAIVTARERGAKFAEVFDRESKHTYRAPLSLIESRGFVVNRGYGHQVALPLKDWTRDDETNAEQGHLL